MKKFLLIFTGLIAVAVINAQSLEDIVNNYSAAIKQDKLSAVSSIKITGKMSAMGMEMPMTMYMKNPNKIKVIYSFNGAEMISVFDGEKGYMINPMMGSSEPVELTGEQLKQVKENNAFSNVLISYFKNGQLTLEGQEDVNGKASFKLKASVTDKPVFLYIDKATYMLTKTSTTVDQMGTSMNVDSYMTDFVETNGVIMPKKTTAFANGMEAGVITFDNIEVNIPMEDSLFKLK